MRIAVYQWSGQRHVGLVSPDGLHIAPFTLDADEARRGALPVIERIVRGGGLPAPQGIQHLLGAVLLEAPLPVPRRSLFCVGRNFRAHAQELSAALFKGSSAEVDEWPIVFTKLPETVIGPHDDVVIPAGVSEQIDYEVELALVIGKGGRNIARADAMSHVFGYTVVNDVTARDVQQRHQQWELGKSFDTFCPMGPWIVTADELDGNDTRLRTWVNTELRQDARTTELVFDLPTLVETCSRGITLYPGDVIATGTPAGVGMAMKPPRWLARGDVVRMEIEGLGMIENRFV